MSVAAIFASPHLFEPISASESTMEGLLRDGGTALFPGYTYYDFRPPIPSIYGTRHPDAALLAPHHDRWWVVEVESHLHDVQTHISPQLQGLSNGQYGPSALAYLERHATYHSKDYPIDPWQPQFLLVVDHATAEIRATANLYGFVVVECGIFLHAQSNAYALAVTGDRPLLNPHVLPSGVDVAVAEIHGVVELRPRVGGILPANLPTAVRLGDLSIQAVPRPDLTAFVLPLGLSDLIDLIGVCEVYRICFDGRIIAVTN